MALSSCEAKYITVSLCICQATWSKNLLKEQGSKKVEVVTLTIDNIFAINLDKNPIAYGRIMHIEMIFHCLRELLSEGRLRLQYRKSEYQVADLLTKRVTIE